jgi:hypothetical protein
MTMGSSSGSISSSSSELLAPESESSILTLPTELDSPALSVVPIMDQKEPGLLLGESRPLLEKPFLGMDIPRPNMVGDESGEGCSARVE